MKRQFCLAILAAALAAGCSAPVPVVEPAASQPAAVTQPTPALTTVPAEPMVPSATVLAATARPEPAGTVPAPTESPTLAPVPAESAASAPATAAVTSPLTPTLAPAAGTLPTPQAPQSTDTPGARYTLKDERTIGAYALRLWHDPNNESSYADIATISAAGQPQVQIAYASGFGDLTGKDITGSGYPAAVVETFTGGAHCCFNTVVFELGPQLNKVLDTPAGNCEGEFKDLDGDKVYEFITCDDQFAYAYCPFAYSPLAKVIFQYKKGKGYAPASPKFPAEYAAELARDLALAQNGKPQDQGEWDDSNKCSVLPAMLDYLYMGQTTQAWDLLDKYYQGPDLAKFREEVDQAVLKSPFYVST